MSNSLEIDSVITEFRGRRILQDVYLKCETGQITGLLGHNGCGKTTLMRLMAGNLAHGEYNVRINGKYVSGSKDRKNDIAYLPQFNFTPGKLTIEDILKDHGLNKEILWEDFPELETIYKQRFNTLSGGEKRMIEIYTVLRGNAKFTLLDEPFSYIMPKHIQTIRRIIKEESARKGILITDHLYRHITDICDDIYFILNGRCFKTKNKEDLMRFGYVSQFKQ